MAHLDAIYAGFRAAGEPKSDAQMKLRAMQLVGKEWASWAHLLGGDGVTYPEWQRAMLTKEEQKPRNGRRITRAGARYRWSDACNGDRSGVAWIRVCKEEGQV